MEDEESTRRHEPESLPLHAPAIYRFPKTLEGLLPWSHAADASSRRAAIGSPRYDRTGART
jgi:hypothetical protein